MPPNKLYMIIAVIVVLLIVLIFAYQKGWLNGILPTKWQKVKKSTFVGAFGRTPGMQHCLAFASPYKRWPHFNRCMWA